MVEYGPVWLYQKASSEPFHAWPVWSAPHFAQPSWRRQAPRRNQQQGCSGDRVRIWLRGFARVCAGLRGFRAGSRWFARICAGLRGFARVRAGLRGFVRVCARSPGFVRFRPGSRWFVRVWWWWWLLFSWLSWLSWWWVNDHSNRFRLMSYRQLQRRRSAKLSLMPKNSHYPQEPEQNHSRSISSWCFGTFWLAGYTIPPWVLRAEAILPTESFPSTYPPMTYHWKGETWFWRSTPGRK